MSSFRQPATDRKLPLIAIVGPTASGKTKLAIEMALKYDGEIICADSRTLYKDMDIGTAKPSLEERSMVPHWGLDLVTPDQAYSSAMFQQYARSKVQEIRARGKLPLVVGGTGLYVDSLIFDFLFGQVGGTDQREKLEKSTTGELLAYCTKNNIEIPNNSKNKRYIIRAIEQRGVNNSRRSTPQSGMCVVGIATNSSQLRTRIFERAEYLFDNGVVDEATMLGKKYGWRNQAMTGNIYPIISAYLEKQISYQEAVDNFATTDWRLAKRQMTWFRRNPFIMWCTLTDAVDYIDRLLASEQSL